MKRALLVRAQYLLPQRLLGRCIYRLSRSTRPAVKDPLIRWFARVNAIDLAEAERRELAEYDSFNDFFTRKLVAHARPIEGDATTLVSPADGFLTEFGTARDGFALQAKGMPYRLDELLGSVPEGCGGTPLGDFVTVYLAPQNYHRVHLPLAGTLRMTSYVPGRRFSVNRATVLGVPGLFCKNERVVCWFDTALGPMAVVLIGALNVSSIATSWLGEIHSGAARGWVPERPRSFERGAEIGRFNLGSTVVTVLPAAAVAWQSNLHDGQAVRVGMALGGPAQPRHGDARP
jgi:phosphatidylserine decarboxylase